MVGDYVLVEDEYFGIEDTLPINIYSRPQDTADVAGSFINLKEITLFFENHFGAYPFERIGFTGTSLGAMEHATNVSYPYSGFTGNTSQEWWYTHELSHMWFGDKVTCATAEEMWMNEGWATFCQIFYLEGLYSHEDFLVTMRDKHKEVLQKTHIVDNGYYALNNVPQEYTYGSTSYDKGATVVNAMRTYLGDEMFYDAITAFLQNFAYQSVSSEEMRDFLTEYTGVDMAGFFDTWVFTPGTPHYSIDSTKYTDGQMDIWVKQKFKGHDYVGNHNIVQIAYLKNNFEMVYDTLVFDGKTGHSVKQPGFEPLDVLVDPAERMMDATIDNYKVFNEAQDYIFPDTYFKILISGIEDSAFVQVTHNWVYADSLKTPDPDITISPTRYWKINGYLPEGMHAGGRFYYDNGTTLDGQLINSPSDSVVVLYRESAADDWHSIVQNRMGIWSVGYIFVEELKKGEYTLAVYNLNVGETEQEKQEEYKVYPNPSNGELNIVMQTKDNYYLKLYDITGSLIDSLAFNKQNVKWAPRLTQKTKGAYLLNIYKAGKLIGIEKVIFIR
jgi:aminopeptidase N